MWTVLYYTDARGRSPVEEFLVSLAPQEQNTAVRHIDLLEEFGLQAPDLEHVRGPIWEVKAGPARVFYAAYTGRRFLLLHGYRKKSRKAPEREITIAERRLADYTARDR